MILENKKYYLDLPLKPYEINKIAYPYRFVRDKEGKLKFIENDRYESEAIDLIKLKSIVLFEYHKHSYFLEKIPFNKENWFFDSDHFYCMLKVKPKLEKTHRIFISFGLNPELDEFLGNFIIENDFKSGTVHDTKIKKILRGDLT